MKHSNSCAGPPRSPPSNPAARVPGAKGLSMATDTGHRAEDLALELFDVVTQICLSTLGGRRRHGDLKEVEFLTLSLLHANGTMIVGDIQRVLGILPAQMSRIIRALETREHPFIECSINPRDKRKIDVVLTAAGERTLLDYQSARIGRIVERLQVLPDEDQEDLIRVFNKLHGLLERTPA